MNFERGFLLFTAVIVALYAVFKANPVLTLKVPKIGFLLWALVGEQIPPFAESEAFGRCAADKDICPWLQDGDVAVSVCGKCGTNWMLTVVHELRTWDQPDLKDFDDILQITPWADLNYFPGNNGPNKFHRWGTIWNRTEFKFRAFKSHNAAYKQNARGLKEILMPVHERPNVKFIAGVRNPVDTMVSMTHFFKNINPEFLNRFGGMFVPDVTVQQLFDRERSGKVNSHLFSFFESWYNLRDLPNVLLVHYSDMVNNPRKEIERIAAFLDLPGITKEAIDVVVQRTSIKFMKEHDNRYAYLAGENLDQQMVLNGAIVRKGGVSNNDVDEELKHKIFEYGASRLGAEANEIYFNGQGKNIN